MPGAGDRLTRIHFRTCCTDVDGTDFGSPALRLPDRLRFPTGLLRAVRAFFRALAVGMREDFPNIIILGEQRHYHTAGKSVDKKIERPTLKRR